MNRPNPPDHIAIFGRPGSGKSSLAERLGADFGYQLVRTGEMLRASIRRGDPVGLKVEGLLARGELASDELIVDILGRELASPDGRRYLFDGFPRTLGQVQHLEAFERTLGFRVGCYLDVAVTREQAIARMTGRRVCPACGATYHLQSRPPRVPETCDRDGTRLQGRPDDALEVVRVRQDLYDAHGLPILAYYESHHPERFRRVDGAGPFAEVYAAAVRALDLTPAA